MEGFAWEAPHLLLEWPPTYTGHNGVLGSVAPVIDCDASSTVLCHAVLLSSLLASAWGIVNMSYSHTTKQTSVQSKVPHDKAALELEGGGTFSSYHHFFASLFVVSKFPILLSGGTSPDLRSQIQIQGPLLKLKPVSFLTNKSDQKTYSRVIINSVR